MININSTGTDSFNAQLLLDHLESGDPDYYRDYFSSYDYDKPTYELGRTVFRTKPYGKIAGYRISDLIKLDDIYKLVHPEDFGFLFSFSHATLKFIRENFAPDHAKTTTTDVVFRMIGKNDREYHIRRHTIINGANKKGPTHYVCYLEDISWMDPTNKSWNFEGIKEDQFFFDPPETILLRKMLSKREIEILQLITAGQSSSEIGEVLHISKYTVDTHRKNMIRKLSVKNTPELILRAIEFKLV